MKNKINKSMLVGMIAGAITILISVFLVYLDQINMNLFYFIISLSIVIIALPFFFNFLLESNNERNKDQMFLEFARDLVEGVKSGTPISKSIINVKDKDYGSLSLHVSKLANQIALGIPVKDALDVFSREVKSSVISRSISLIREAELSGGKIETILESVAYSVSQIEKLRKERKAAIYNLVVQGYIIFIIFILIMLIMQFKILPITSELNMDSGGSVDISGISTGLGKRTNIGDISNSFLYLLITQGFFAGLVIGKISEGSIKSGLKHSFILVALAFIISTGAKVFF